MRRPPRPVTWGILAAAVVVVATVAVVVFVDEDPTASQGAAPRATTTSIRVDGVSLSAEIITPAGTGRVPLLVMPASWGADATMYHLLGESFARAGYQVVAYAQRGWRGSTGEVDMAGAQTQRDASGVIDWALAHTRADPRHIGMLGISYGAGISLLTAAHDKRVRAVVSLSTWTDLVAALDQNDTPNILAMRALVGLHQKAPFDSAVLSLRSTLLDAPARLGAALAVISPERSPQTYLAALNRNDPAIMISNGFEDSIFDPAQLVPFFNSLTTPKRLELGPGDHTGPALAALGGETSPAVSDARMWLDHYLRGVNNGIDSRPPIVLRDIRTGQEHAFTHWPVATASSRSYLPQPGDAGTRRATTWTAVLHEGVDSPADAGPPRYEPSSRYRPPTAELASIRPDRALFWAGPTLRAATTIAGSPSLRLNISSSATSATLFAYLYDIEADGVATLLGATPFSLSGMPRGHRQPVTISLQPTSYTIPAGHRLGLVIDAADPRYQSLAPSGTQITISSSVSSPAWLALPPTG